MAKGTIALLLAEGFEDSEFAVPYRRLKAEGFEVQVIGKKKGEELKGYKGKESIRTDLAIDEARVGDYIALVIPGGHSPDKLRADERFVRFVRQFDATGLPLAAVCHGPQLLLTADLVEGRTLTAWPTVQFDLKKAGAEVKDEEVVVDDNWITSRKPEDLDAFTAKILEEIGEAEERGLIRAGAALEGAAAHEKSARSQTRTSDEEEERIPPRGAPGKEERTVHHSLHENEADIDRELKGKNLPAGEGPLGAGQPDPGETKGFY